MTLTVNAEETALPELLEKLQAGDTVLITSGASTRLVAKMEALSSDPLPPPMRLGALAHLNLSIPNSFFFDPLPEEELRLWKGDSDL